MSFNVFDFMYSGSDKKKFAENERLKVIQLLLTKNSDMMVWKLLQKLSFCYGDASVRNISELFIKFLHYYYCLICDYRIREVDHLKEHNSSLMMPEILAITVVTMNKDIMAWKTMSKPNIKIIFFSSCIVLHNRFTNMLKNKVRTLD